MKAVLINDQHLTGLDLAYVFRIHQVKRTGLGGHAPGVLDLAQIQRAETTRITNGNKRSWR